jgi:hypothetical protein
MTALQAYVKQTNLHVTYLSQTFLKVRLAMCCQHYVSKYLTRFQVLHFGANNFNV